MVDLDAGIVICGCGADSRWVIADEWICCDKCGQEYLLCEPINVNALNIEIIKQES